MSEQNKPLTKKDLLEYIYYTHLTQVPQSEVDLFYKRIGESQERDSAASVIVESLDEASKRDLSDRIQDFVGLKMKESKYRNLGTLSNTRKPRYEKVAVDYKDEILAMLEQAYGDKIDAMLENGIHVPVLPEIKRILNPDTKRVSSFSLSSLQQGIQGTLKTIQEKITDIGQSFGRGA
ncbi:MAG: hypothetical protein DHS20C13_22090 [Thermodesulfobacteriota bacterium]|nr:MAG: hypothetical protein DHS20C13_22090 [Thermodesulfobacteriota bacterium]